MKKITSFLSLVMLCCISVFAQEYVGTDIPADKLVKIGTVQTELVPGQWYFIHTPRNANQNAEAYAVEGMIQSAGGLVYENGGSNAGVSATSVIDELSAEEGVNANDVLKYMIRFHAVEDLQDVYTIEYANGKWMGGTLASISKNEAIAGNAGKFNFYLVENITDGTPNTAGRFAWNKYDMANRVDNNGAGYTLAFWAEGKVTAEEMGADNEDIKGNKIWEIFNIEIVGDVNLWDEAFASLLDDFTTVSSYTVASGELLVVSLANGENVGTAPGNYKPELVEAFLALHTQISDLMDLAETDGLEAVVELYPNASDLDSLNADYVNAYTTMVQNKVSRAMTGIKPGYYTINSALYWYQTVNDTTFYTQEEADAANDESGAVEGEEGYIAAGDVKEVTSRQVPAAIKSLMAETSSSSDGTVGQWVAYGPQRPEAKFLWKISAVEGEPTKYRLETALNGKVFKGISQSTINGYLDYIDTATVCFDFRNDKEPVKYMGADGVEVNDTVVSLNIRASQHPEDGYNYIHCNGHSSGAATQNWCVGWADGGATRWYLAPVDEATADAWINGPEAQVKKMVEKGDSIAEAFPAQLKVAKDLKEEVVTDFTQFSSPYSTNDAQSIPSGKNVTYFLLDGVASTYWHSRWEDGSTDMLKHYLQIDATEALNGEYFIKMTRRPVVNDHPTKFVVVGYDANDSSLGLEDGVQIAELEMPFGSNTETINSDTFAIDGSRYIRLYVAETRNTSNEVSNRGYWHASELNLLNANPSKRYETSQYEVRKAEADALEAVVAAWNEAAYASDSVELFTDEAFLASYNALIAAYEAWSAVYVNPAALRSAIAGAPSEDLFVKGSNPGQWAEGAETPAAAVAAAVAYNAAGKYTAAESEAHIAAINKVIAEVYANANPVEEGVWYNIKFGTEEMYEGFGWDKSGAASVMHSASGMEQSLALFGKVLAAGTSVTSYEAYEAEDGSAGEVALYTVETAEEFFEGQSLVYLEADEDAGDASLFRFIAASDSTFMIQNKATGLYVRATYPVTLSAIPSVYEFAAIGAGASTLRAYNVIGGEDNGYNYLHAQRSTNTLTTWDANSLGSNSMMFIEAVEEVTEAPSNDYVQKLWPGQLNAYAMPVDVTVAEGATAYAAQLTVSEEDTTVVLMAIEAEVIKAGTPFILVADQEGDYITYADRLAQIKENLKEDLGVEELSSQDNVMAASIIAEEYMQVNMKHGEVIAAQEVDTLGSLVGTFANVTVSAGKGIQTKENGFTHMIVNTGMAAYRAWVACDFDAESDDVLKGIEVKIEGSIDTGINEVLNNVAKGGDIYTVGGQLVGKGNINTVNNLPAGIYVVNGVKVIKK